MKKHWFLINLYDFDANVIIPILDKMRHPYIYKYGDLWMHMPSIYQKEIYKNKTLIELANKVGKVKTIQVAPLDSSSSESGSDDEEASSSD